MEQQLSKDLTVTAKCRKLLGRGKKIKIQEISLRVLVLYTCV